MISKAEMTHLRGLVGTWKEKHKGAIEKGQKLVKSFVRTATIGGTAFMLGAVEGHKGEPIKIANVPLNLAVAVAGTAAAHLGLAGKRSNHVQDIADGALALAAASAGLKVGAEWKAGTKSKAAGESSRLPGGRTRGSALNEREAQGTPSERAMAEAARHA